MGERRNVQSVYSVLDYVVTKLINYITHVCMYFWIYRIVENFS